MYLMMRVVTGSMSVGSVGVDGCWIGLVVVVESVEGVPAEDAGFNWSYFSAFSNHLEVTGVEARLTAVGFARYASRIELEATLLIDSVRINVQKGNMF